MYLLLVFTLLFSDICPPGDVKFEAGKGYEYGADLAEITINGPTTTWYSYIHTVKSVCVKSSTNLYYPESQQYGGTFTTPDNKDVSHVVLYLERPTKITISEFKVETLWQRIVKFLEGLFK